MPYDYSKLIGRIIEKYGTRGRFAAQMPLSERSLSLKLNGVIGWKQYEIDRACKLLDIPMTQISIYFFAQKSSQM